MRESIGHFFFSIILFHYLIFYETKGFIREITYD